ncbi:MAG TPA: electron transfer flavoprotein subunit beta/FixA family protein [Anaerolineae bacterium]|nr:electron transfer flavoprotein subunit beta/FixA family protein [Anaerolineae bacterium]
MKILVCVKQVLDPTGITVNRKAEKMFINREDFILDPASKAALEAASDLKQAGAEVSAISVGPEPVEDGLREALGRGADRAIWIRSEGGDAQVVANLIAAAVRKLGEIDLIITGHQALDTGAGELAPRLAEALDWPQILGAAKIDAGANGVTAIVQTNGFVQVEASLPVVVALLPAAYRGSLPNGWRLMDAYKKWNVEAWSTAELDLGEDDLRPLTTKKEDAFPPERQLGTPVRDVKELVTMLKREKVIANY